MGLSAGRLMAVRCHACGHGVSTTARFCPECGARQPMDGATAADGPGMGTAVMAGAGAAVMAGAGAGAATGVMAGMEVGSGAVLGVGAVGGDVAGGGLGAGGRVGAVGGGSGVATPSRFLPAGLVLGGGYVIEAVVGEGGMGVVYRAWDRTLERRVAVKCLHLNLLGDAEVRRRFVREARVMTRWSHPHIVSIYDFVETDNVLGLVMEYIEGSTLMGHLERWRGGLPLDEIGALMGPILDAMACAHAEGVVHRDLKPDNILLDRRGGVVCPKVVDFGIAKILEGTAYTVSGALLGTWRYIAPEQAQRPHLVDHRADIYALGVTLYHLIEGRLPFDHDNPYALLMDHVSTPPPAMKRAEVPGALVSLVMDCLEKDPARRPQSCDEVGARLRAVFAEDGSRVTAPTAAVVGRAAGDDGMELVAVPAGVFLMGEDRRAVWLDGFSIDRFPVTNRQFARFVAATGYRPEDAGKGRFLALWRGGVCPPRLLDHPVVYVSWHDARAYAAWVGRRLPSEAQWEKAARGTDGRVYPWGRASPTAVHARFGGGTVGTSAVGAHPAGVSPFGVLDLAGNVWEWCVDVDDPAFYADGPERNPCRTGPPDRGASVVRGGSWAFGPRTLRTWSRRGFPPDARLDGVGFRCAL